MQNPATDIQTDDIFRIGKIELHSRLIVGTGKHVNFQVMKEALEASGAQMETVAIRRIDLESKGETLLDHIDLSKYVLLPNTAGCYSVEDAVRVARLARSACRTDLIKLEVIGDAKTLLPDNLGLLEATKILVKEGFIVMPYTTDDPVFAKRLEDAGAACVMPLAPPIRPRQGGLERAAL